MIHGAMTTRGARVAGVCSTAAFIAGPDARRRSTREATRREHREVRAVLDITEAVSGSLTSTRS